MPNQVKRHPLLDKKWNQNPPMPSPPPKRHPPLLDKKWNQNPFMPSPPRTVFMNRIIYKKKP